ncbi:MAG: thioredoxin family protein [Syntrophobacterales bacterium]|jgi:thioredoxin-related protein
MSKSIQWRTDWQEALDEAQKTNLPLALEFFMEGCPACGRLTRETHLNQDVVNALNNRFVPVRLEARDHMDLVEQYQVTATPTILLFSPAGEEKHRFDGFQTGEEYLKELTKDD